jgi:hypothetical protein
VIRTTPHPILNGAASQIRTPPHPPGAPWGMAEGADWLGISERHLHTLAKEQKVRTIWLGHRRMIPPDEMERLVREGTGAPEKRTGGAAKRQRPGGGKS